MSLLTQSHLRSLALLGLFLGLGFLGIQFIRPPLTNPPVLADFQAPAPVKSILTTSCYSCHSNKTRLPWYDQIVPAYWLVVKDVNQGREHLNFSDFSAMPAAQQKAFLYESVNQIRLGAMPPRRYTLIHPDSIVTAAQLTVLQNYLHPPEPNQPADSAQLAAADAQYTQWIHAGTRATQPVPALNGLAFFPDYPNWKPVSTTDRYDNHTLRVILGNEVAILAIAQNKIHPWPDGSAFAKISWAQQADDKGAVQAGKFIQVEFMTKDARKYASTEGWGFGRWKGMDLVPYGKDANFATECTSCHAPLHDNDFVYTMPIKEEASDLFNQQAVLPADLPDQPFQWKVIASTVDKQQDVMSTLYGNDLAVSHARTSPQGPYPVGAILSRVTWHRQEDRHWFGGRIPGQVQSVEFVIVDPSSGGSPAYSYQVYEGTPLQKLSSVGKTVSGPRIDSILGQRASVMP